MQDRDDNRRKNVEAISRSFLSQVSADASLRVGVGAEFQVFDPPEADLQLKTRPRLEEARLPPFG